MRLLKGMTLSALLLLSIVSFSQTRAVYTLTPIQLTNGWQFVGTITTDGTLGNLTTANILDWNLKVIQITDFGWTEKNSSDANITGVFSDGKKLTVATSPDGIEEGGTLHFAKPPVGYNIPTTAVIADFTQLSTNLGYVGGMAGWMDEIWGLNFVELNQRDNSRYQAASFQNVPGKPNTFAVKVPILSTSPLLMTMFGTVTTDGTIGALLPRNIISWNITARNQELANYAKANSTMLTFTGVTTDGKFMRIGRIGQLQVGIAGRRPTFVTIADFTDPEYPNGFANYYKGNYWVMGDKSPLIGQQDKVYTFASRP